MLTLIDKFTNKNGEEMKRGNGMCTTNMKRRRFYNEIAIL